ncbi:uncharacterized protein LOC114527066 [Dendronephthya gigantea]|uniref:uncharacterized protein LOC114527066 n=1 Tax=Dendronephthya gigantea TaxID=151771 RepID=UPI001069697A|nr:uncharacterized protein LOC114527066 [Dendronephthya gigantea]
MIKTRNLFPRIIALILLTLQAGLLDYFLVKHQNLKWLAWIVTDVFIVMVWTMAMLGSTIPICSLFRGWLVKNPKGNDFTATYVAWLAYALHFAPQVATIFKVFADELDRESFLNPNFLKLTLSITPMLFVCLVYSHHKSRESFARKTYVQILVSSVTLDLFDSVEILEYLFDKEFISSSIEIAIIVFACVNFCLPVLALYELKNNEFRETGQVPTVSFKLLYVCSFLFLVNIPFLVIRAYLWHTYKLDVSILFAKNILGIYFGFAEIYEYYSETRPTQCHGCDETFAKSYIKNHMKTCLEKAEQTELRETEEQTIENVNGQQKTYL